MFFLYFYKISKDLKFWWNNLRKDLYLLSIQDFCMHEIVQSESWLNLSCIFRVLATLQAIAGYHLY